MLGFMRVDETMPPIFHAPPELWERLKPLARQMRHEPTPAEDALWQRLRRNQLNGFHFRRQVAIERFIVDFICLKAHLIIEVDGSIHDHQQEYDEIRQDFLEAQGYRVIRFSNEQVLRGIDFVLGEIASVLQR